jgi:tagatose-6-phosphate ketose/aldose isomerase
LWTACEIEQQPLTLRKTHAVLLECQRAVESFLRPLLRPSLVRVVLAGAGTSAFIGECLAPYLGTLLRVRVDAIPTTDLVCAPYLYFLADTPTLLVSFGRSGDSPESVAAIDVAEICVHKLNHFAITCNPEGALARRLASARNGMAIVLPEEVNDRGFAMTSSFTAMAYAARAAFSTAYGMQVDIEAIADAVANVIATQTEAMKRLAGRGYERVVYLGSHMFKGLAREAALKVLELTDGGIVAVHDSSLGFRHGPKTIVNAGTLIVMFVSNDAHARQYDLDLLEELRRDCRAGGLLVITASADGISTGVECILVPSMTRALDIDLLFPFIAAPQVFAFEASLARGLRPDSPNAWGTVNRVVQGVRIHPLT